MNREIKFRAWDKDSNKMIYAPVLVKFKEEGFLYRDSLRRDLMQYTGVNDKNGKEIYEGDIIEEVWVKCCIADNGYYDGRDITFCYGHELESRRFVAEINFDFDNPLLWPQCENMHETYIEDFEDHQLGIEVIGNIYENPELINGTT